MFFFTFLIIIISAKESYYGYSSMTVFLTLGPSFLLQPFSFFFFLHLIHFSSGVENNFYCIVFVPLMVLLHMFFFFFYLLTYHHIILQVPHPSLEPSSPSPVLLNQGVGLLDSCHVRLRFALFLSAIFWCVCVFSPLCIILNSSVAS